MIYALSEFKKHADYSQTTLNRIPNVDYSYQLTDPNVQWINRELFIREQKLTINDQVIMDHKIFDLRDQSTLHLIFDYTSSSGAVTHDRQSYENVVILSEGGSISYLTSSFATNSLGLVKAPMIPIEHPPDLYLYRKESLPSRYHMTYVGQLTEQDSMGFVSNVQCPKIYVQQLTKLINFIFLLCHYHHQLETKGQIFFYVNLRVLQIYEAYRDNYQYLTEIVQQLNQGTKSGVTFTSDPDQWRFEEPSWG